MTSLYLLAGLRLLNSQHLQPALSFQQQGGQASQHDLVLCGITLMAGWRLNLACDGQPDHVVPAIVMYISTTH